MTARPDDVVGYTYKADIYCPACIIRVANYGLPCNNANAERVLDVLAEGKRINRGDETTFDSDDFPKVIFRNQVENYDTCESCAEFIVPLEEVTR